MRLGIKDIGKIFWQAINDFSNNRVMRMSAALAYYTIFSLAPMLIVIISLCDVFYGHEAVEGTVYEQIRDFVGEQAAQQIQVVLRNATVSHDITWASVVGIVSLVLAATGVFTEIQYSINVIWCLKTKPKKSWIKMLLNRALSFSMVIGIGFILLVSLVINTLLDTLFDYLTHYLPQVQLHTAYIINYIITFATISFLFAIIFKVLPDARVKWKDVWVGALTTAVLFMIGKFGIGYYLAKSKVSSTYGAAGSVVIILLWVYYSATILYFGAAFTRAYTHYIGRHIHPNEYAVYVRQIEVETLVDPGEAGAQKKPDQ
ncbi:YihY/virulence factor BrkB family protein [Deminuibacter soli]|uniref:YihY/virulence factor BrkB family protein n=1 Tax=Deminuibacter soli TaxID=2291815 RepID=A0A3E1NPA4_9BACT|nr:YihY/virulence factor BrkB family protein [Deminuibacter soli]RFM29761.1 YihY/virulence factor BrkB family protein [Deminuibacter soli]